jgi:hypothetical protein
MKNEMDVLRMDERQRICWLLANRTTLIAVGLVWIGMIIAQAWQGRVAYFMIAMVPVFGLFRLMLYRYYARTQDH